MGQFIKFPQAASSQLCKITGMGLNRNLGSSFNPIICCVALGKFLSSLGLYNKGLD